MVGANKKAELHCFRSEDQPQICIRPTRATSPARPPLWFSASVIVLRFFIFLLVQTLCAGLFYGDDRHAETTYPPEKGIKRKLPPSEKQSKINGLSAKMANLPVALESTRRVIRHASINGIEMGVLDDGTPYLSELGLAQFCGIDQSTLNEMSMNWQEERLKPRGRQIEVLLARLGHIEPMLYRKSDVNGTLINAYVESTCMAILEYYAFHPREPKQQAIDNFRTLARFKFRDFVYEALGYKPKSSNIDAWQQYHDRVDLTQFAVEVGYFCVFNEIASIMVPLISIGVDLGRDVILDISIGLAWSKFWVNNNLDEKYGPRKRYEHFYPEYFPQAKSNPQEPFAYPDAALGEFRRWLRAEYVVKKLPNYLTSQARLKKISTTAAINATLALTSNSRVTGRQLGAP